MHNAATPEGECEEVVDRTPEIRFEMGGRAASEISGYEELPRWARIPLDMVERMQL